MAALLTRPRRKRSLRPAVENIRIEDGERMYRICLTSGSKRVLMVMLKCSAGGERALDVDGRRARQLLRKINIEWRPVMDDRTRHG